MYRIFVFEHKRSDYGHFIDVKKEILLKATKLYILWNEEKFNDFKNWLKQKHKSGDMWQWFDKIEVICLRGE